MFRIIVDDLNEGTINVRFHLKDVLGFIQHEINDGMRYTLTLTRAAAGNSIF